MARFPLLLFWAWSSNDHKYFGFNKFMCFQIITVVMKIFINKNFQLRKEGKKQKTRVLKYYNCIMGKRKLIPRILILRKS